MATTTTVQGPPTEAEIRKAVDRLSRDHPHDNERRGLDEAIDHLFYAIAYERIDWALPGEEPEPDELGAYVWAGLGGAEAKRLAELVRAAKGRAFTAARPAILEEVVAAAMTFASEFPDAPRAPRKAATA